MQQWSQRSSHGSYLDQYVSNPKFFEGGHTLDGWMGDMNRRGQQECPEAFAGVTHNPRSSDDQRNAKWPSLSSEDDKGYDSDDSGQKDYGKAEQGKEGEELSHHKAAKSITQYEGNLISTVEERKATYSWLLFI